MEKLLVEDLNEVAVMTASVLVLFHQCVVDMFLCDTKCLYTSKVLSVGSRRVNIAFAGILS